MTVVPRGQEGIGHAVWRDESKVDKMKFSNGSRVGWVFVHRLMPLVRIPIVGVLFAFGLLVSTPCFPQGNAIRLVSDEEARLPDGRAATTRAITRGPGLKLISPADVVGSSCRFTARRAPLQDVTEGCRRQDGNCSLFDQSPLRSLYRAVPLLLR